MENATFNRTLVWRSVEKSHRPSDISATPYWVGVAKFIKIIRSSFVIVMANDIWFVISKLCCLHRRHYYKYNLLLLFWCICQQRYIWSVTGSCTWIGFFEVTFSWKGISRLFLLLCQLLYCYMDHLTFLSIAKSCIPVVAGDCSTVGWSERFFGDSSE